MINAGSSSIKFALYRLEEPIVRSLRGKLDRLGREDAELTCIDEIADPPRRLRFDDRGPRPTPTA